jgi:hypothetical protein
LYAPQIKLPFTLLCPCPKIKLRFMLVELSPFILPTKLRGIPLE